MTENLDTPFQRKKFGGPAWLTPSRSDEAEDLDLGKGSLADVAQNLKEMWRTNRYLGGLSALTQHLYPRLESLAGPATVLDLGTGGANVPEEIVRWSRAHDMDVTVLSVDLAARNLAVASERLNTPEVRLLRADALQLPVAPQSVDYAISSLFMHHFCPMELVELLRRAFECSRWGIIMTDLTRGWLPLAGFQLVRPVFARNPLTRHDGLISIRRAYTPSELLAIAWMAGLRQVRIYSHFPWRMTLVVDRGS